MMIDRITIAVSWAMLAAAMVCAIAWLYAFALAPWATIAGLCAIGCLGGHGILRLVSLRDGALPSPLWWTLVAVFVSLMVAVGVAIGMWAVHLASGSLESRALLRFAGVAGICAAFGTGAHAGLALAVSVRRTGLIVWMLRALCLGFGGLLIYWILALMHPYRWHYIIQGQVSLLVVGTLFSLMSSLLVGGVGRARSDRPDGEA